MKNSQSFIVPVHAPDGKPQIETSIMQAVAAARADGVTVNEGVCQAWAPAGYAWNDGGEAFQQWLKSRGTELSKGKVGKWWTVAFTANVTKRDSKGTAVAHVKPFPYPTEL